MDMPIPKLIKENECGQNTIIRNTAVYSRKTRQCTAVDLCYVSTYLSKQRSRKTKKYCINQDHILP